jgi:hypothetical protein
MQPTEGGLMENNRTVTVGTLLEYLDGRGLVIEDDHAVLKALEGYFDLTFETDLAYYIKED